MNTIKNLKELFNKFSDEQKCRDFLVQQRWNGSPVCPYCNSNKWYSIENGKRFKCGNKECYKKYSVTVGTIFHASNIPLTTWLPAMYLITSHKKGLSSCQLAKHLGVCQKTAWHMIHRIRESLRNKGSYLLDGTVEIDEMYYGLRHKNISNKKREALQGNKNAFAYKTMIVGMLQRGGELRLQVAGQDNNKTAIHPIVYNNVDISANLMTDGEGTYVGLGKHFASHQSVNHNIREYVRQGTIHTNSIEGAFGLFRRTIIGTYHKISPKHLSRYCDEMQYRYNTRQIKDGQRFEEALGLIESRLSWKDLTKDNGLTKETIIEPALPHLRISGKKAPIGQIHQGKIIATYPSIVAAERATGIKQQAISGVLRGFRKTTGGYEWKYL